MPEKKLTPAEAKQAAKALRLASGVAAAILDNLADSLGDDGKVDFSEVVQIVLASVQAVGEHL